MQSPACVVAAVDYDIDDVAPKDRVFRPLWGGAAEGKDIGKLLGVDPLMGHRATKSAVLNVSAPRVLHLATHGVFFDSLMTTPQFTSGRVQAGVVIEDHAVADEYGLRLRISRQEWIKMHNEWYGLPRCAVALAGVNSWMLGGQPKGAGNGLLTASDVVDMDLEGTDVVVLSACDTALGRAIAVEGLLGLRRAFLIAGARAVIASSWKVPDQATLHLMKGFYGRCIAGQSIPEALRGAQLDTRSAYPEPRFWGAFTCLAASRPWPSQLG